MNRLTLARAFALLGSVAFLALSARELIVRGGPGRARTIASRTGLSPRQSENALLALARAGELLPRDVSVVFVNPAHRDRDVVFYHVALGQLPRQRVVTAVALTGSAPPDFVVTLDAPFDDPRYANAWPIPSGTIYRRR